jgi:hypothetical protein
MGTTGLSMRITHPFHPQFGQSFDVVSRNPHWGEDRVIYRAEDGTLPSIGTAMTDMAPPDAFRRVSDGRAAFRLVDLQQLLTTLDRLCEPDAGNA